MPAVHKLKSLAPRPPAASLPYLPIHSQMVPQGPPRPSVLLGALLQQFDAAYELRRCCTCGHDHSTGGTRRAAPPGNSSSSDAAGSSSASQPDRKSVV